MTLLFLLTIAAMWLYVGWIIRQTYLAYRERQDQRPRKYRFRLHEKPPDASEPKRRSIYRPPRK